jgi:WD40 repeat protein/serine/threonine protein kinase
MADSRVITCDCGKQFVVLDTASFDASSCPACGLPIAVQPVINPAHTVPEDSVPEDWKPGDVYLDRYEVMSVLGQGAMGKVFKIYHRGWNQMLAVKCPRREAIEQFGGVVGFEHECETWIRVGLHPNTVACYYARALGGLPRVFAEYVSGGTLYEWIHKRKLYTNNPQDDLRRIIIIAVQMAWGLHHAHKRGVIHQDIKPANIMMTAEGVPKVTDFGLARRSDNEEANWESSVSTKAIGLSGMTPAYCSPEQAFRDHITHRTDLWSWALSVFEMFAADIVWPSGTAAPDALERWLAGATHRIAMPPPICLLMRNCFRSNPADRPSGLDAVATELCAAYETLFGEPFPLIEPPTLEATGDTLNNRAISLMDFGKQQRAMKVWERALREAPGHPQSAFNYGLLRWREGTLTDTEAMASVRASRESRPGEPLPIFLELRMHVERGAITEAEKALALLDEAAPGTAGLDDVRKTIDRLMPASRGLEAVWPAHQGGVTAMALDAKSGRLYTGGEDNRVMVWDASSGESAQVLDGHHNTVSAVAWSAATGTLASVSLDRRLRLWDLGAGTESGTHAVPATRPRLLTWLDTRGTLLLGDSDGTLHEINPESGLMAEPLARVPGGLRALAISHVAGLVFAGAPNGDIHVLTLRDFSELDCLHLHSVELTALAASPDGKLLASADATGALIVSEAVGGAHVATLRHPGETVVACAFAGGGRHLVSVSSGRVMRLWQPALSRCLWSLELPASPLPALQISADGTLAWVALANATIARVRISARDLFDSSPLIISQAVDTGQLVQQEQILRTHLGKAATLYKDAQYARTASQLMHVRSRPEHSRRREVMQSWMRLYAKLPRTALRSMWEGDTLSGHHGPVRALALSLQATYLMSGGNDATIRVWDLGTGKLARQFSGHAGPVRGLALGESQERLVSSSDDGTLKVWNVRTGRCERTMQHPGGAPEAMALSPDGRILATAGWELHLWDVDLGVRVAGLPGHEGGCTAVAWARSARFLVSGGADARITFWNPDTGTSLGTRKCPHGPVTAISVSPLENLLVSAGGNPWDRAGKACLWDVVAGTPARIIEAHDAPVAFAALTLDSRFIVTAAGDGLIQVHTAAGDCVRKQTLGANLPGALVMANDASRVLWSDADGTVHSLCLDWELSTTDSKHSFDAPVLKLFANYVLGQRPVLNRFQEPAPPGTRTAGWALNREPMPHLDGRALQRFNYLSGCAGMGVYPLPAIETLAIHYLESLKQEKK